jgi:hypothetical protein
MCSTTMSLPSCASVFGVSSWEGECGEGECVPLHPPAPPPPPPPPPPLPGSDANAHRQSGRASSMVVRAVTNGGMIDVHDLMRPRPHADKFSRALSYLHNFGAKMQLDGVQSLSPRHLTPFSSLIAAASFGFLGCGYLFHLCLQVTYIRAYIMYIINII